MHRSSDYGVRIRNIEAATIYETNQGVREHVETKSAMLTNSLFLDFLLENGLEVLRDGSTRDVICLEFNFGAKSYEQHIKALVKTLRATKKRYRKAFLNNDYREREVTRQKKRTILEVLRAARDNKEKYKKLNAQELREEFYVNGVDVPYKFHDGKEITIHYQMLYRSAGKAKKGTCMFICDRLYKKAHDFLYMGIELSSEKPMIVEASAYAPLVSSSIVDRIRIEPENILILEDIDSFTTRDVISVETDEKKHCIARLLQDYKLKNTIFDGQALIDSSIFPEWGNGYILLRHHFCKMAAFCCNIQKFFKDYYGDHYETATVTDIFGKVHRLRDVEVITTENAMKWMKFQGVTYEDWCERVHENGCMFGIVKTAHESKLGDYQRMSYQMVNALDESIMEDVVKESVDYLYLLKSDTNVFLEYLKKNKTFANDYEALCFITERNPQFVNSEYFRSRRYKITNIYLKEMKSGHLIQNAENLVIVGSPFAMLLYGATGNKELALTDPTFKSEDGCIQCYTERFDEGEYLAEFRSPFNSKNNMGCLHNIRHEYFDKYFVFGKQIVAVNMISTDFQDRNNGSDQDSDSLYVTNKKQIVEYSKYCYSNYPTIVNNIPKETNVYPLNLRSYAVIDNSLAEAQRAIGESSNLAQICLTYTYNFDDPKYADYACILSVLAQVAIDSAKRRFDISIPDEIQRIKNDMGVSQIGYPLFWKVIRPGFSEKAINRELKCPMNYVYGIKARRSRDSMPQLPMSFFVKHISPENKKRKCKKVEALIVKYSLHLFEIAVGDLKLSDDEYLLLRNDFDDMIEEIRKIYISRNYLGLFSWLLSRAFLLDEKEIRKEDQKRAIRKNKSLLFRVLYEINKEALAFCLSKNLEETV